MIRTSVTCLLIAVVLTCPYFCLGEAVGEMLAPGYGYGCGCIHDPCQPGDQTPDAPSQNNSDCFCQGAISDGVRSVEFDLELSLHVDWIGGTILTAATPASFVDASAEPPHHFPPFSTGRDVCALTCALLL